MSKSYPQIGSMIQKKDKQSGAATLDANGKATYYIKIDKNTKLSVNGVPVEGYLNISRPRDKFDRMLEKGSLTEKEHAEKIARFEKGGDLDFVQFEIGCVIEK